MTVDAAKEAAPMKDLHPYRISDAARQAFHEDGVVCLRGLLEAAALEGLRSAIDRHLQPDGWYFQYIYMWQKDSVLADVCFHSSLPQAAVVRTATWPGGGESFRTNSLRARRHHPQLLLRRTVAEP